MLLGIVHGKAGGLVSSWALEPYEERLERTYGFFVHVYAQAESGKVADIKWQLVSEGITYRLTSQWVSGSLYTS